MRKIRHSKEWYYRARIAVYGIGLTACILPTLLAALIQLPMIVDKSAESTLSGVFVAALVIAALPLYKVLVKLLKSPSAALICWILFALMFLVGKMSAQTVHGLTVVFLCAALGNTIGAFCFRIAKEFEELWRYCGQVFVNSIPEHGNGDKI